MNEEEGRSERERKVALAAKRHTQGRQGRNQGDINQWLKIVYARFLIRSLCARQEEQKLLGLHFTSFLSYSHFTSLHSHQPQRLID